MIVELTDAEAKEQEFRTVVRLKRSYWSDKRGVHMRTDITFMARLCLDFNILAEDCMNVGAGDVLPRIMNLGEIEDGLYEVTSCNERRDNETGHIYYYDYKLIPFQTEAVKEGGEG
jgi:hypothetical protein